MSLIMGRKHRRLTVIGAGDADSAVGAHEWSVRLELDGLVAGLTISLGPRDVESPLCALLREIADSWRGWSGVKEWKSYEDGLTLSFTHDRLGHVRMVVHLRDMSRPDGWSVGGVVPLEAGAFGGYSAARQLDIRA